MCLITLECGKRRVYSCVFCYLWIYRCMSVCWRVCAYGPWTSLHVQMKASMLVCACSFMKEQRVLVYQKNHKSQYLIFYCNEELIHPSCSMTLLDSYGVVGVVR